jgi:Neprosin
MMTQEHVEPHPEAVATTTTSNGRLLDWIPIESQTADRKVATPPPSPARHLDSLHGTKTTSKGFRFELDDPNIKRGPKGTVPILRDLLSHRERVQRRGADKRGPRYRSTDVRYIADPNPFGYYHADSAQSGTFFGGMSDMTVYTPILENAAGHSIYQMWLTAGSPVQSAEAGWTVDPGLNGDLTPHLFTYFTTNGYTQDGDNLGGYNRLAKGWVQSSATGFPGMQLASSSIGQYVNRYDMLYMLWQGNWWFKIESEWLGYYPASLYGSGGMASDATWLAFGGEVYSGLPDPAQTNSQMGSGRKGESGSNGYSAWQRNILAIASINASGGLAQDFNGTSFAEDSSRYDIVQSMRSGTNWGSVIWAGGSGTGPQP